MYELMVVSWGLIALSRICDIGGWLLINLPFTFYKSSQLLKICDRVTISTALIITGLWALSLAGS
jgi:hypothetical protein